jgi:hypothetical protein
MDGESVRFGPIIYHDGYCGGWLVELKSGGGTAYLYRSDDGSWVTSAGHWIEKVVWLDLTDEEWRYAFEQECDSESFKQSMKELIFR